MKLSSFSSKMAMSLGKLGVARKNPIPQREIDICKRIREARRGTNLSQVAFARLIELDSSRLASYEHARVPVRVGVALAVAQVSGVSLCWLATGAEPKNSPFFVDKKLRERLNNDDLFSRVYDKILSPLVILELAEHGEVKKIGDIGPDDIAELVADRVREVAMIIPPLNYQELYSLLFWDIQHYKLNHAEDIAQFEAHVRTIPKTQPTVWDMAREKISKSDLTAISEVRKVDAVKTEIEKLLARVRVLVSPKGMKAKLAAQLKVPQSRLSEWLGGKCEPSGETTLRLLHWVEQQERQK